MDTQFLPSNKLRIQLCEGALCLKLDGQKVRLAPPERALPLSRPDNYVILRSDRGVELGVIADVEELEPESRKILRAALALRYRVRRIEKVLDVHREDLSGQVRWRVLVTEDVDFEGEPEIAALMTATSNAPLSNGKAVPVEPNSPEETAEPAGQPKKFRLLRRSEPRDFAGTYEVEFRIAGSEDIQTARYPKIYIHDLDGNRYEILNCEILDPESRRSAERYF